MCGRFWTGILKQCSPSNTGSIFREDCAPSLQQSSGTQRSTLCCSHRRQRPNTLLRRFMVTFPPLISKLFVFYHKTNVGSGIWSFKMSRSFDASQPSHISSMLLLKNKTYCYCWGKNQFSCPSATVCMLDSMRVAVLIFNKFTDELAKCLCPQSFNLHVWNMLHVQHRSFNWNTCKCVTKAQGKT